MSLSIDVSMRMFARFISASWDVVTASASGIDGVDLDDFVADWMQANWEILVESLLRAGDRSLYLEPYGDGADCNGASSRVYHPKALPTHRVVCVVSDAVKGVDLLTGTVLDVPVVFDRFGALRSSGWYAEGPPFDCVVGYCDEQLVVVRLEDVTFQLECSSMKG